MTKSLASLPEDTAKLLIDAKKENYEEFLQLVRALGDADWPLRAIAEPFGVSRATAGNWYKKASNTVPASSRTDLPSVPVTTHGRQFKAKKIKPDIPQKDLKVLLDLASQAKQVTRWTPETSPLRKATREMEEMILFYTQNRRVPVTVIARHLGVTRRAVAQRIEKYKD